MTVDQNTHNQEYWIDDSNDLFTKAKLLKTLENNTYEVKLNSNNTKKVVNKIYPTNASYFDNIDNLSELPNLNEPSVLNNLNKRFENGNIYTFSGLFLVAVNPYEHKPDLYSDAVIQKYHNDKSKVFQRNEFSFDSSSKDKNALPPHVFAISEEALKNLFEFKKDQSILVTGESGAGKTENTKKILQYLTNITQTNSAYNNTSNNINFEDKILESNPILESFGNATTVKNNNSSRFGKFIKVFFDTETKNIKKTFIDWYLLEKSRVTLIDSANERNYHVFYQLLKGIANDPKNEVFQGLNIDAKATDFNHWNYLKTNKKDIQNINDSEEFNHLITAFNKIGFTAKEQNDIFKVVSAILHLGNVTFTEQNSKINNMDKQAILNENDHKLLKVVADLLGIADVKEFEISLTEPKVRAGRETVKQKKNCKQSKAIIDSLSKIIYEKLFGYIVSKINKSLDHNDQYGADGDSNLNFIGLLDIAGFEIFDKNSLEQLLINFTNENLQQFFNHHMFILEQEEYMKEGITWNFKDYGLDLQHTIDLLSSKPNGILPILDEETIMPNSTDDRFYDRLIDTCQKNARFERVKVSQKNNMNKAHINNFIVKHYAGSVEYDSADWLHKNKEPLNDQLQKLLHSSKNVLLRDELFVDEDTENKKKVNSFKTQTQRHSTQLNSLINNLRNANPHFIRCILPNRSKSSKIFDKKLVLDQLTCNGVLEGIRISREGFPNRIQFESFVKDYQILLDGDLKNFGTDSKQITRDIMNTIKDEINEKTQDYQFGKTKILFRTGKLAILEKLKQEKMASIVTTLISSSKGKNIRTNMKKEMEKIYSAKLLSSSFKFYDEVLLSNGWFKVFAAVKPLLEDDDEDKDPASSKKRSKLSDILSKNEELVNMVNSLEKKLTEVKETSKKITEVNTKLEDDIMKTQNERSALISKIEGLEADLDEKLGTKNKEIESINTHNKTVQEELFALKALKDDLVSKEKLLTNDIETLTKEKESLMKGLENKDKELNTKMSSYQESSKVNDDLKSTIEKLKAEIEEKNLKIKELEDKLTINDKSIDIKLTSLETKFNNANDKVLQLVKENQDTRAELSSIKMEKSKLEKEALKTTSAFSENEMKLKNLQRDIRDTEKSQQNKYAIEQEKYKTQIAQLLGDLDSLRDDMASLKAEYEDKIKDLTNQHKENLRAEKSIVSAASNTSSADLNNMKFRVQQLENDLYKEKLNTDYIHQKTLDVTATQTSTDDPRTLKAELLDIKQMLIKEKKEKSDALARIKFLRTKLAGTNMDNEEMNIKVKKMISVLHENKISIESIGFNSNVISLDERDQEYVNVKNQLNKSILELDQMKEKLNQEVNSKNKAEQQMEILKSKMVDLIKPSSNISSGIKSVDSSMASSATLGEYSHSGNNGAVLELKKQLVDLKDVLDATSTNLLKAEQKITQLQREESRLNMKIISLEKDLEASSRQNQLYSQSVQEYKEDYHSISEQLLTLEARCRQSDLKIIEQNEKLYQLGAIVEKSKDEHMNINKDLMLKEDRVVELEDILSGKEIELEKMKQLSMLLNEDVEHMKSTLTDFSRDTELIGKIEILNSKISKMSRTEIELNKKISNLEFDFDQLEKEHELKLTELTRQNEHYLKQNSEFLNLNQNLQKQVVELTEENHKEKNEIEKLNEMINLNEIEKKNYMKEKDLLMDSLDSKDDQIEIHINEKKDLIKNHNLLKENLDLKMSSLKRHEELLNKLNNENDHLQDVLTTLKADTIDLEKENEGLADENDDLRLRIQDMHNQIGEGSNERDNWNTKLGEMSKRLSKETEDKFEQIKENKKLMNEIDEVNMNLDKCMRKLNNVENENIKLNERLQLSDIKLKQVTNELNESQNQSRKAEMYASNLEKKMANMEQELELWKSRYQTKVRE